MSPPPNYSGSAKSRRRHLNRAGLRVQLSEVDLLITGQPGTLLGGLLCSLAGLLNSGGTLQQIANLLNQILAVLLG
jgi:hypothetical protein